MEQLLIILKLRITKSYTDNFHLVFEELQIKFQKISNQAF